MGLIDTHAHITCDELYERLDEVIENAKQAKIERILCICLNLKQVHRAFACKERFDWIDIAVGFHPSDLYEVREQDWKEFYEIAQDERIIAIGEIGLDYHWDDVEKAIQKDAFVKQIHFANDLGKPILVHMRDATKDTMDILREHKKVPGILHCFSGSLETAMEAIQMGMYISVGGPLTFKNARGLPEVIRQLPLERLMLETDCPYLTPHPFRGMRNEPKYLPYTMACLAQLKGVEESVLLHQLKLNYQTLFHKSL